MDSPHLLPDGESVLFSVTTSTDVTRWDEAQIVVQSLRTGERTVVWQGGSDARYVPTGHLVYAVRDGLYAMAFDVDSLTVRGGPVPMVAGVQRALTPGVNTGTANFGVSAQGSLVYVSGTSVSNARTLALVGRDGVVAPLGCRPRAICHRVCHPTAADWSCNLRRPKGMSYGPTTCRATARSNSSPSTGTTIAPSGPRTVNASRSPRTARGR